MNESILYLQQELRNRQILNHIFGVVSEPEVGTKRYSWVVAPTL